jgi:hypothetical protein
VSILTFIRQVWLGILSKGRIVGSVASQTPALGLNVDLNTGSIQIKPTFFRYIADFSENIDISLDIVYCEKIRTTIKNYIYSIYTLYVWVLRLREEKV